MVMIANSRTFILYVLTVLITLPFTLESHGQSTRPQDITFSQFLNEVDQGRVRDVLIQGPEIHGTLTDGRTFQTYAPSDLQLAQRLYGKGVSITARPLSDSLPWWLSLIVAWIPFVIYCLVIIFFFRIFLRIQAALEKLSNR
jgi:cell division protease FtsH